MQSRKEFQGSRDAREGSLKAEQDMRLEGVSSCTGGNSPEVEGWIKGKRELPVFSRIIRSLIFLHLYHLHHLLYLAAICPTHPIHHNVALDSGSEENYVRSQSSRDITHVLILVS